ncbi:hypothetical protein [uncultured Tateyamaria sp.]|uniref:hypothetical protein n=1 Tax=uncultured Tateyamaria sp. TaxID=455651 RepID=UPI00261A42D1|nr:hypothetical protein [uncultured Tateyamaria sp.]
MTSQPIFIHAGAHRTGTSSFQMCLHENRTALEASGLSVAYPGRDGIPSGDLALRLPGTIGAEPDGFVDRAARTLADHGRDRPLILSEENIPGRMFHFMRGQFYPMAAPRCEVLRKAWPGQIAHVVLVVRPYDALYVSGFRKRAEDNAVPSFDELRATYMAMDRGWPAIVEVLRDVLRPDLLTVVPYAQRGTSVDLLQRLVPGIPGAALKEPKRVVNLSATDAALEVLQDAYRSGEKLPRAQWKKVIGQHAQDRTSRGFAEFSVEEKNELSERYASDLKQIEWMDGVSFG